MSTVLATTLLAVLSLAQESNRAHVRGQFVDAAGRSVPGASVLNRVWPGAEFPVQSDAEGNFEATVEWRAGHRQTWFDCTVRVLGCERWHFDGSLVPGQELDLGLVRLRPGGAVSGFARLASAPAESTQILVVTADELPPAPATRLETGAPTGPSFFTAGERAPEYEKPIDRGQSARDGSFRIVGLPPGRYGLWLRCEASFWATSPAFEVRAAEETVLPEVILEPLPPEHWIEGTVVDMDGVPVIGAKVQTSSVARDASCFGHEAISGVDGRFRLFVFPLACGAVELRASVEDERLYETRQGPVEPGRRDVLLRLGRMQEVELVVRDAAGREVTNFSYQLSCEVGDRTSFSGAPASAHPGGRCLVRFPEQARAELTLEAPGFADAELELDPNRRELAIVLEPAQPDETRQVTGRVTAGGRPVPGAHVDLARRDMDLVDDLVGRHGNGLYRALDSNCGVADAEGRFHVVDDFPWEGTFVVASAEGYAPAVAGPFETDQAEIEIALTAGGVLGGRLQLPGGVPAGDVVLRAYRSDVLRDTNCMAGREFRTRTDASGDYRFEHLLAGAWLVSVEPSPGDLQRLGWSEADGRVCRATPFVFTLGEGRFTSGDLELATPRGPCGLHGRLTIGDRIREGYVYLQLVGEQALRMASAGVDSEGRFELSVRAPGTYRLVMNAGPEHHQYRLVTDLVTLTPGDTSWERNLTEEEWKEDGVRLDRP